MQTNQGIAPSVISDTGKAVISDYVKTLSVRGFCKIDDSTSNSTRLLNRFNGKTLPLSFIDNDFSQWLYTTKQKCSYRSPSYIIYTLPHVVGSKFVPIDKPFFTEPQTECLYVNTYRKYTPQSDSASISPLFHEFLERLVPDKDERHIFTQWLAHIFQRPQDRPSWHVMLTSLPGTGKGFLVESILTPLLMHQTSVVNSYSKIMGQFSTVLEDNLLVLLDDPASGSDDTQTKLKSLLSEERAYSERKGLQATMVNTYTRFILASNDARPLRLEADERRWFSPAPLKHRIDKAETQQFIATLAEWLSLSGALSSIYNWFMTYDLKGFNPKHIVQSENLLAMIGLSINPHVEFMRDYIEDHVVFRNSELVEEFKSEGMQSPSTKQMPHLLQAIGYKSAQKDLNGTRIRVCFPQGMEIDDIRRHRPAPTF